MKIAVGYVPKAHIGYGRMGIELVAALGDLGVEVVTPDEEAPALCYMAFPSHAGPRDAAQLFTCLTMWEGDHLPETFRDSFHCFDRLLVPSSENVELFGQHHHDVRYQPLGINPARWGFVPRSEPVGRFTFLTSGRGQRKGVDLVARAFHEVFGQMSGADPEPHLVVLGALEHPPRNVTVVASKLSAVDEVALYAQAHTYVAAARGEGWGMRPLQAIAQGCPTILTDAHGHRAFSHLGTPIPATLAPAATFAFGDAGQWWEPDYDALCTAMLAHYTDWTTYAGRAEASSSEAHRAFTWQRAAEALINNHGSEVLSAPYEPSGIVVPLDHATYPLRVNRRCGGDIGGVTYRFEPDTTYDVPADVLEVMRRGGYATDEVLT